MLKIRQPLVNFSRQLSSMQRQALNRKVLVAKPLQNSSRRNMGGHGPDISVFESFMYIVVGGGGIAAWGVYKTTQMKDRIEAFETGQIVPLKILNDEEFFKYKAAFVKKFGEEEDDEEEEEVAQVEDSQQTSAPSSKDTVIFIGAPN